MGRHMGNLSGNFLFSTELKDGLRVESVFYGTGTLYISCQAGCAVGCPFCASGSRGLVRNLSAEEMIQQVEAAWGRGFSPVRITVSGIGEPLHNPHAFRAFHAWSLAGGIPVSLTTTGAPLTILEEFLLEAHNGLMISLHAGREATHRRLVPGGPELGRLFDLLETVWPCLSRRRRRKIGINYLLLKGVNDESAEIELLAGRIRSLPELTVHLLTLNPVPGSPFVSPSPARVEEIHRLFAGKDINVRRANRWRRERKGGCGTLMWGVPERLSCGKVPLSGHEVREEEVK